MNFIDEEETEARKVKGLIQGHTIHMLAFEDEDPGFSVSRLVFLPNHSISPYNVPFLLDLPCFF